MRCPRHDLALASDGTCLRCRREQDEAAASGGTHRSRRAFVIGAGGAVVAAAALAWSLRPHPSAGSSSVARASAPYAPPPSAPPLAALEPATVAPEPTNLAAPATVATPLERAMHAVKIVFYSRPATADCGVARAWLVARGYTFKERDVDADPDARAAWRGSGAGDTIPAFDIDGQAFGGFDPARVQSAIEYAGARRLQRGLQR